MLKMCRAFWVLPFLFLFFSCGGMDTTGPKQAKQKDHVPSELKEVWSDPEGLLKKAQALHENSQNNMALAALERILVGFPKSSSQETAQRLYDEIQQRLGLVGIKIGVMLPLSGSYQRYGESLLDGISCGIGLFEPCSSLGGDIQIVVRDTKGKPENIAPIFQELTEKENVFAIIGPLLSVELEQAIPLSAQKEIPLITLAPQKGTMPLGNFVFQHSLIPETEMGQLAKKVAESGIKKFVIFYPKNKYGDEYRTLFAEKFSGKIIAEKAYPPDAPDFVGYIQQLKEIPTVKNAIDKGGQSIGLFLPDSFKQAIRIAEALDSLFIQSFRIIGTSRLYHPKLASRSLVALNNAIITTPFDPDSQNPQARFFSDRFAEAYGNKPAWLEAFGYDALAMLTKALQENKRTQTSVAEALRSLRSFNGVVGDLSWTHDGFSQWTLHFVSIQEGRFISLDPNND